MRKPAKIGLGIFGSIVAIIVIAGIANGGNAAPVPAAAPATSTATATPTPPTATPPPTTTAAAPPADELFVAAVVDSRELVKVGRSICGAIGTPDVTHASLVAELGASKWGAAVAEAVVASAEQNLCPERQYVVPPATPAPKPEPKPEPKRERAPQPEPAAAPRAEAPSSAYYKNCTAARAAGAAPLHAGEPGYRAALDRDKDGTACE